jgi:3-methyladenine DNA glycosylase AlkD
MKTREAKETGKKLADLVSAGKTNQAYKLLTPILDERTKFSMLDHIGVGIGSSPLDEVNTFLECIAADKTMGGWTVIGSALQKQLDRDLVGALQRCQKFILTGDVWYSTDILGERVSGPALVNHFHPALEQLMTWREKTNRWVRRAVGVSVHFWAKRSHGAQELTIRAESLLGLLEPLFEEWEMDALKGVAWGLKTLGRHYPDLMVDWLVQQVVHRQRRHRALMLRKATTYLTEEQRLRVSGKVS